MSGSAKGKLTPQQYDICFRGATEAPFTGKYVDHHESGIYKCVNCGNALFSSDKKFDSGTGWPSFRDFIKTIENQSNGKKNCIRELEDYSLGVKRIEVKCSQCDAHLGHVFDEAGGRRFCINSACLSFEGAGGKSEK